MKTALVASVLNLVIALLAFSSGRIYEKNQAKLPWYTYLACIESGPSSAGATDGDWIYCHNLGVDVMKEQEKNNGN